MPSAQAPALESSPPHSPKVRSILESALLSRFVEEALLDLYSKGGLNGTVHTCIGQEMSGATVAAFLRPGDTIFSNHRCHGHFISRTRDVEGLVAELMGRQTGVSGGLGGSQHLYKDGFYSNGIQGGIVPVAAGLALGHKLQRLGNISVVFIGDGTLGEGVVYETFNLVSKWNLPLLIVLEDNKYAQSTEQHETLAGEICKRAEAFGIETTRADTWNWEALSRTAEGLIEKIRSDSRPHFLHIDTYRLKAHSKGDDTRAREVLDPYERKDPLNLFMSNLAPEDAGWVDSLRTSVQKAIEKSQLAPHAVIPGQSSSTGTVQWSPAKMPAMKRLGVALNETLAELMKEHEEIFLMGEDILSPYGGAFKVTRGLSDTFPERVRNTPISEACIVGMGSGLGLLGFYPLVEIMFGDFLGLAFDQIVNHAAKFQQMYNQKVFTNVVIRTPMGGGRGYGPTHSQTLDRHFLGAPGLRVLALNSLVAPGQVYRPLIAPRSGPTLMIENKLLYGCYLREQAPDGYKLLHSDETFPSAWIRPESDRVDVTLLGYGGTCEHLVEACETLFDEHDIVAQVLLVTQIYPLDVKSLLEVISNAPALLIVEEGQGFASFGAEIVTQLAESDALQGLRVRRHHPAAYCIPSSGPLEKEFLPSVASIVANAREVSGL
jgi:2-oxoisovalerate dehydrogenase E1 component